MKYKTTLMLAFLVGTTPLQAETLGTYLRNESEPVRVFTENGLLYCTRVEDNFEICNGMASTGENTWQGDRLKNPNGPRWMSARGTITISESYMALEGCMMGGAVCKSMTWPVLPQ